MKIVIDTDKRTIDTGGGRAIDYAKAKPDFVIEQPAWPFNESKLNRNITHWPGAWLKRKS